MKTGINSRRKNFSRGEVHWRLKIYNLLFAKNEKEFGTLIQTIRIYSQDVGMEFGIEKYAMLIMESGKREITEE